MTDYVNFLIPAGFIFFAAVATLKREYGVYLTVLLLPSYQIRFQIHGVPMTFLEGMILILVAVEFTRLIILSLRGAAATKQSHEPNRLLRFARNDKRTLILIFLFLLAALISVFVSPVRIKAAGIFKAYFLEAVLFYFLVILAIDSQERLDKLFKALGILAFYLSIFGIYQFITLYALPFNWWGVEVASRRIISVLNHPNALALLLGPILAILIMLPKKSKLFWAAVFFGLLALYLSFSRAALLALIATILGLTILSKLKYNSSSPPLKLRGGWGALLFILLMVVVIFTVPFSRNKILDLIKGQDLSQQNRYVLWDAAFGILKKSPIFGVGLMGFHEAYKNYPLGPDRVVQNYPHNFFLNFWVETGLLGLISMIGLLIVFSRKIWRQFKNGSPYALAVAAGMSMIVLHGLVDVSYFKNDLSVLFWLIFAIPNLKTYES